jgi:outer membrane beta-barrel protein
MKRILIAFLILLGSVDAFAKVGSLADAPSIRHQLLLRKGRHEITPAIGLTMGDVYSRNFLFQVGYQYHITDWIAVGGEVSYAAPFATNLADTIATQVAADPTYQKLNPGRSFGLSRTGLQFIGLAKVSVVPLSGKLVWFGKLLGYADLHVDVGGGGATVRGYGDLSNSGSFAVLVGGGMRFFPTRNISVNLDIKDYMIQRVLVLSRTGAGDKTLTQNPAFMAGVSFFLPGGPEVGP